MPHGIPWDLRRRGLKDARRHDARVQEAIRKNLRHLIVEESIISSRGNKKIRVPVRYLDHYHFRHERDGQPEGVGQGEGQPGDVIARRANNQGHGNEAGDQPGEEVYEAEITIDEVAQMMLEDMNLPLLEESGGDTIETDDIRFDDVRRKGIFNNLDKRRTLLENLKRQAARGQSRPGNFDDHDLRFRVWNVRPEKRARAAVYMLMDRSASMTTEKKYIAKGFYFWLTRFLKMKYDAVELVFISHDVDAHLVTEEEFFQIASSGGTRCSSAYHLALQHIREYHPPPRWNSYVFHFSDGENLPSDNERVGQITDSLLEICRMVGYGEIHYPGWSGFYRMQGGHGKRDMTALHRELSRRKAHNLVLVSIDNRDEIYRTLRRFLASDLAREAKK